MPLVPTAAPQQAEPAILKETKGVKSVKAIEVTNPKEAEQMRLRAMALRRIPKSWQQTLFS